MKLSRVRLTDSRRMLRVFWGGCALAVSIATMSLSAFAQDAASTDPVEGSVTQTIDHTSLLLGSTGSTRGIVLLFVLAAAGLFYLIFRYLNVSRDAYYTAQGQMIDAGWTPVPIAGEVIVKIMEDKGVQETVAAPDMVDEVNKGNTVVDVPLKLDGPSQVLAGSYTSFTLMTVDGSPLPSDLSLVPDSDSAARVTVLDDPSAPAKYVIHATGLGPARLLVEHDDVPYTGGWSIEVVKAPEPQPSASKSAQLMVFGLGSHTLILATLVVIVLLFLSLDRVITGEAVASILGVLIGYLFGVNVTAGAGGESPSAPPAS